MKESVEKCMVVV